MLHLRVVCPQDRAARVVDDADRPGRRGRRPGGGRDVRRLRDHRRHRPRVRGEVLDALHALDVCDDGMIAMEPLDTAIGALVDRAERDAPGEGADVVDLGRAGRRAPARTRRSPGTFLAFMVLATLLASIGVVTDSPVTVVGAMVVGPEFGPLAGLAVGIMRRRFGIVRRGGDRAARRVPARDRGGRAAGPARARHGPDPRVRHHGVQPADRVHLPPGLVLAHHRAGRRVRRHAVADLEQVGRAGRGVHLGDDDPGRRQRRCRRGAGAESARPGSRWRSSASTSSAFRRRVW